VTGHRGATQSAVGLLTLTCLGLPGERLFGNGSSISPLLCGICVYIQKKMPLLIQQLFESTLHRLFEKL